MTERPRTLAQAWQAAVRANLIPSVGAPAAIATMFLIFLLTDLASGSLQVSGLAGFGFAVGSTIAAAVVRRAGLLIVSTTPPVVFLVAITCAELITAHLSHASGSLGRMGAGIFLTLSAAAPWMLGGLAGALAIALLRGLPQRVRDLRADVAGRGSGGPRDGTAGP
ncbi:MAG: DUF6542 domain-containing protein, partial [Streptosporangiaceae bacterium]